MAHIYALHLAVMLCCACICIYAQHLALMLWHIYIYIYICSASCIDIMAHIYALHLVVKSWPMFPALCCDTMCQPTHVSACHGSSC